MGHWGQAMALLFSPNPFTGTPTPKTLQEGCPAVERAKALGPKTQREREYIAAVDSLCQDRGTADLRARVGTYAQAMELLAARRDAAPAPRRGAGRGRSAGKPAAARSAAVKTARPKAKVKAKAKAKVKAKGKPTVVGA